MWHKEYNLSCYTNDILIIHLIEGWVMSVSSTPSIMPVSFIPFNSTEQFHHDMRAQLAKDIDVLFAYAELPSPLLDACRYVMTGTGKLVRPLLVASAFASTYSHNDTDNKNSNRHQWQGAINERHIESGRDCFCIHGLNNQGYPTHCQDEYGTQGQYLSNDIHALAGNAM